MSKYINGLKRQDCTTEFLYLHCDARSVAVLVFNKFKEPETLKKRHLRHMKSFFKSSSTYYFRNS